ncbi:MAG TPA: extracellular solute-binding protein [Elusimicrobiota bacterium]|nr:extracellular solute-binding protein [Elusimicrobiota bacterium]
MSASRKPVELQFWVMPNAGFETRHILRHLLDRFHKTHPNIRVTPEVFPWSVAWDRLMNVIKDGRGPLCPDVFQIGSTWTCTLAFLGALRELTPRLGEIDRDNFIPTVFESCYLPHTRKLYALPWFIDLRVLYYRRDVLRAAGLGPEALETWDSFRRSCRLLSKKYRRKNLYTLALSLQKGEVLIHDLAPWIWGAGGSFLTADEKHASFHREDSLEGLRCFFSLMEDGSIPLFGRDRFSSGNFFSGHAAFQFSGAWPLNSAFKKGHPLYQPEVAENFGAVPFPLGPAGRFTFLGGSHLAVSAMSRHPEESWSLVRFLSTPEAQLNHARAVGTLPCRASEIPELFGEYPDIGRVFLESLTYARILPQIPTLGTVERVFSRCAMDVVKMIVDKGCTPAKLQNRMADAALETNYILSLYG